MCGGPGESKQPALEHALNLVWGGDGRVGVNQSNTVWGGDIDPTLGWDEGRIWKHTAQPVENSVVNMEGVFFANSPVVSPIALHESAPPNGPSRDEIALRIAEHERLRQEAITKGGPKLAFMKDTSEQELTQGALPATMGRDSPAGSLTSLDSLDEVPEAESEPKTGVAEDAAKVSGIIAKSARGKSAKRRVTFSDSIEFDDGVVGQLVTHQKQSTKYFSALYAKNLAENARGDSADARLSARPAGAPKQSNSERTGTGASSRSKTTTAMPAAKEGPAARVYSASQSDKTSGGSNPATQSACAPSVSAGHASVRSAGSAGYQANPAALATSDRPPGGQPGATLTAEARDEVGSPEDSLEIRDSLDDGEGLSGGLGETDGDQNWPAASLEEGSAPEMVRLAEGDKTESGVGYGDGSTRGGQPSGHSFRLAVSNAVGTPTRQFDSTPSVSQPSYGVSNYHASDAQMSNSSMSHAHLSAPLGGFAPATGSAAPADVTEPPHSFAPVPSSAAIGPSRQGYPGAVPPSAGAVYSTSGEATSAAFSGSLTSVSGARTASTLGPSPQPRRNDSASAVYAALSCGRAGERETGASFGNRGGPFQTQGLPWHKYSPVVADNSKTSLVFGENVASPQASVGYQSSQGRSEVNYERDMSAVSGYAVTSVNSQPAADSYRGARESSQSAVAGYRGASVTYQSAADSYRRASESNQPAVDYYGGNALNPPVANGYTGDCVVNQSAVDNYMGGNILNQSAVTGQKEASAMDQSPVVNKASNQSAVNNYREERALKPSAVDNPVDRPTVSGHSGTGVTKQSAVNSHKGASATNQSAVNNHRGASRTNQSAVNSHKGASVTNQSAANSHRGASVTNHSAVISPAVKQSSGKPPVRAASARNKPRTTRKTAEAKNAKMASPQKPPSAGKQERGGKGRDASPFDEDDIINNIKWNMDKINMRVRADAAQSHHHKLIESLRADSDSGSVARREDERSPEVPSEDDFHPTRPSHARTNSATRRLHHPSPGRTLPGEARQAVGSASGKGSKPRATSARNAGYYGNQVPNSPQAFVDTGGFRSDAAEMPSGGYFSSQPNGSGLGRSQAPRVVEPAHLPGKPYGALFVNSDAPEIPPYSDTRQNAYDRVDPHLKRSIALDRTPTDEEINFLWERVRTCLGTKTKHTAGSDSCVDVTHPRHSRANSGPISRLLVPHPGAVTHAPLEDGYQGGVSVGGSTIGGLRRYGSHEVLRRNGSWDSLGLRRPPLLQQRAQKSRQSQQGKPPLPRQHTQNFSPAHSRGAPSPSVSNRGNVIDHFRISPVASPVLLHHTV